MHILSITDTEPSETYRSQLYAFSILLDAQIRELTVAQLSERNTPADIALALQNAATSGDCLAVLAPHAPRMLRVLAILAAAFDAPFISGLMTRRLPRCERLICANRLIETIPAPQNAFCATIAQSEVPDISERWTIAAPFGNAKTIRVPSLESFEAFESTAANLDNAQLVFAGGRGLGSKANFEKLRQCAEKYHAGLAASRLAVDLEWCRNDLQIGQTGKAIAPQIYVAFGISGAIQHLAGIQNAKKIIAINTDKSAPIFEYADIGVIADAREVIDKML